MIAALRVSAQAQNSQRVFTGSMPDPVKAGLYRYETLIERPSVGPKPRANVEQSPSQLAWRMANWIARNDHIRPFFTDAGFVAEFGRSSREEIIAAVDELWRRGNQAAAAAGTKIRLPARLGGAHHERN